MDRGDEAAIEDARRGDRDAFRALVERHGRSVFQLACRMTGNTIDAEDIAQETFLKAYRAQDWDQCDLLLLNLQRMNAKKYLYELYSERVASMRLLPFDPEWDGATNFETK